ncbi:polymorphic toxin-type HINT domain-containing protein [Streptomyces tirandamycinicus]|uniref:polymorphic toxin-type HINT domain-containing protein n=1 Tax=Streptomyces tirandamycinicus TaxID=2174846 RepID=UPI001FCA2C1F|nr:polymorphic toxin-type HINT domain-containing protein [Streptomyces tirandamycinicus]
MSRSRARVSPFTRRRSERRRTSAPRGTGIALSAVLVATLLPAQAWAIPPGDPRNGPNLVAVQQDTPADPDAVRIDENAAWSGDPVEPPAEYNPTDVAPPAGGNAAVPLDGADGELVQAGTLPVRIGQASPTETEPDPPAPSGTWDVEIEPRTTTEAADVDGAIITVTPPGTGSTPVDVELDYGAFEDLYGTEWSSRLRLTQLPECFLTTPELEECTTAVVVPSENDPSTETVRATVDPAASQAQGLSTQAGGGPVVLAATDSASGAGGTYKATPLSATGTWSAGGSGGGFSWTYPLTVPSPPAGPAPKVAFTYSSQSVDGRTSVANGQASWIGDGWDYHPGFVERRYRSCSDDRKNSPNNDNSANKKKSDLCWASENLVLSLGGSSTELVHDDASGAWVAADDDGARVEYKAKDGSAKASQTGEYDGEHWVVTTRDGTRYWFGRNALPGRATATNSAFTVPVFGNHDGEPCHATAYAESSCTQAWRWNLDYVEDVHGNAMIIDWKQETNRYAKNEKFKQPVPYVRGGHPTQILYGLRSDNLTGTPAGKVVFTVDERCIREGSTDCSDTEFESRNYEDKQPWWDTPSTLHCKVGAANCYVTAPTFWSRMRLTAVTAYGQRTPGTTSMSLVDRWNLHQSFPRQRTDTHPPLWLESITRTGYGTARDEAGNQLSSSLPPVSFLANVVDMPNRVARGTTDQTPDFDRLRVETIRTETGAEVYVDYSAPCPVGTTHPAPSGNTSRCFPVHWSPDPDLETPPLEWFNKYVVDSVTEKDRVARQPAVVTTYTYEGGAAWAKGTDEFTKPELRTYDQWRGYAAVVVKKGVTANAGKSDATEQSQTRTRYFRGMSGDAGRPAVTVKDSTGTETLGEDLLAHQGRVAETITYTKAGGSVVARELTWPYSRKTASRARPGLPALEAYRTGTTRTDSIQTVSGGATRTVRATMTYESTHDLPVTTHTRSLTPNGSGGWTTGDQTCATTSYVHNIGKHLIGLPERSRTTVGDCAAAASATGDQVVSDVRTAYDALGAFGINPVKGLPFQADTVGAAGTGWITSQRTAYDALGRVTEVTDAAGHSTTTAYSPVTGPAFEVTVTNALGHASTSVSDPARGNVLSVTDPNGRKTSSSYDDLGRVTGVWSPSRTQGTDSASALFTYQIADNKPPAVTTRTLRDNGTYEDTVAIYDGLLRPRQTQTEALGGGRIVTDSLYNAGGTVRQTNNGYLAAGEPEPLLFFPETVFEVPNSTETAYDGLDRAIRTTTLHEDVPQHSATVQYSGDWTLTRTGMSADGTTPLSGSRAAKTWTDALGRTSLIQHFTAADLTTDTDTSYVYDPRGKLAQVTDAEGNDWTYTYDARGRLTASTDPDTGSATFGYNALDQRIWSKDGQGREQHTLYDALGRQTELRDDSPTGSLVAKWTFDSLPGAKGHPVASTRYHNGAAFTSEVTGYDSEYRPTGSKTTIPSTSVTTGLAGTYAYSHSYTETGSLQSVQLPATPGGLAAEKVITRYNGEGAPVTTSGLAWYTADTRYSPYGEVLRTVSGEAPRRVWTTHIYNANTGRIHQSVTDRETLNPSRISALTYGYDTVGNITSITDTQSSSRVDRQCFAYDPMGRLVHAWTGTTGCPTASGAQGSGPDRAEVSPGIDGGGYWQSYAFDAIGNRTRMTVHDLADPGLDDVHTYTHGTTIGGSQPAPTVQPHTLTKVESTVREPGSTVNSQQTYAYDSFGNTTQRVIGGNTQALTWDRRNKLTSVDTDNNGTPNVTYLYDASGNRLIEDDGTTRTLYLGEAEITVNTSGQAMDARRYYSHPGAPTTVRTTGGKTTGHKLTVLLTDHHNTATNSVDQTAGQGILRRTYDPYGNPRGTEPADWPDRRTYLGVGIDDPATGLTHIGAREYDSTIGRFISADPLIDITDPMQMNGYTYANGSPVTGSDPSGLYCDSCNWDTPQGNLNGKSKPEGAHPVNTSKISKGGGSRPKGNGSQAGAPKGRGGSGVSTGTGRGPVCSVKEGNCFRDAMSDASPPSGPFLAVVTELVVGGLCVGGAVAAGVATGGAALAAAVGCGALAGAAGASVTNLMSPDADHSATGKLADQAEGAAWGATGGLLGWGIGTLAAHRATTAAAKVLGKCSRHSFLPGTRVKLADGSIKDIEDVTTEDKVLATDPETGETANKSVAAVITTEDDKEFITLTVSTDDGPEANTAEITATDSHPFWVPGLRKWVDAGDLKPGNLLRTSAGTYAQVTNVDHYTKRQRTHDLTVADIHTYYVLAGKTPVLVHNAGECPVTGLPHGALGESATLQRLQNEGYTNITREVRFKNSQGDVFRADFVAQNPAGNWVAVEVKTGRGASLTDNQALGYAELGHGGAVLNTSRVPGLKKGSTVTMKVEVDLWRCPDC